MNVKPLKNNLLIIISIICFIWLSFNTIIVDFDLNPRIISFLSNEPLNVSLIRLISHGGLYHNLRIRTEGFLILEFENKKLYTSKENYKYGIDEGIWVSAPLTQSYGQYSGKYCSIEGIFNAQEKGRMRNLAGSMQNIKRIEALPDRVSLNITN